ncbi:MAG: hypothetical protein MJ176_03215 [Treponema sp.]|nr:hypothetical protein [Treponema sp.]
MFVVRKEVAETILKKSNPNHDSLGRFTFGKKLAPNTGINGGKTLSEDEQRCLLANTTDPIEGIEPLQLTVTNLSIIHDEIKKINESLKNGNYQYNGMKITSVDEGHLYSHFVGGVEVTRPLSDLQSHAAYLPFVMPILNSNCGHDTKRDRVEPDGRKTYEFVKRATITENNKSKNIGIALILKENERNELTVSIRTIFRLFDKKNLIKSWQVGELNLLDRQNALLNSTRTLLDNVKLVSFKCFTPNKIIANRKEMSSGIQKANEYSVKRIKKEFQKDFTVKISDVTENNKVKKIEQLEKALNCVYDGTPFKISHVPADSSKNYGDVTLRIKDFDKSKIEKAVRNLSFSLDVPLKAANGEVFYYKAQEELTNIIVNDLTRTSRALYDFVINYFGLPERTIMSKAYLKYKGKILYSPETGEPINKRDWKKFVKALELFLNRNHRGFGKKIVLTSRKLGKLLEKMAMYQTADKIRVLPLSEIKEPGKKSGFNWNENDPEKIEKIFSEKAEKWESARVEIAEMSAAQKITKIDDVLKNDIQQILIDGIKNKKSKGQVSQDLFDRCASLNRDIQRIADTEIQNNVNNAFISETVKENEESGKKTYFIRREVIDGNTCEKCKKLNGKIAVWSNSPLENEKVKDPYADYAIWDGKDDWNFVAPNGVKHPYCYSDDTEVMTNNGWKLFKDVTKEDLIMSINPETKEIDFVRTVRKIQYDYNGKMILFPGRNYNQLVTPDHNMLYVARNGHGEDHLKGIKAEDLIKRDRFSLPRAIGDWKKEDKEEFVNFGDIQVRKSQLFRLWGWYLSEGSGRYKNHENKTGAEVKLAQKIPERIIVDLPDLKDILHIGKEAVYFYGKYAAEFSSMFGIHAEQKYIPDFIKKSSKENILNFLNAFVLGDGSCVKSGSEKGYSKKSVDLLVRTSSPKMANDLCEIIVKAGFMPSINVNRQKGKLNHFLNGDYILKTDCYNISICTSKNKVYGKDNPGHLPNKRPEYVDYNGKVYDVELEKWHFLLVKRNGKCAWSGNCRGVWDSWDPEFDEKPVEKSLTWSGYKLQGRKKFAGFNISIENKKGSYREGTDPNGHKWKVKMYHDYGYIRGSVGTDGDHVDCYLGPNENAKKVYIIHQQNPDTKEYDEDKCMIGFDTQIDAKNAYLKQYDRPGFLQSITTMDLEEFRNKVLNPENKGKMIKSLNAEMQKSITQTIEEIFNR